MANSNNPTISSLTPGGAFESGVGTTFSSGTGLEGPAGPAGDTGPSFDTVTVSGPVGTTVTITFSDSTGTLTDQVETFDVPGAESLTAAQILASLNMNDGSTDIDDDLISSAIARVSAYEAADADIRTDFAAADNTVRGEFAAADATATTDRGAIRTEFAAADTQIRTDFAAADTLATNDRAAIRSEFATADDAKADITTTVVDTDVTIVNNEITGIMVGSTQYPIVHDSSSNLGGYTIAADPGAPTRTTDIASMEYVDDRETAITTAYTLADTVKADITTTVVDTDIVLNADSEVTHIIVGGTSHAIDYPDGIDLEDLTVPADYTDPQLTTDIVSVDYLTSQTNSLVTSYEAADDVVTAAYIAADVQVLADAATADAAVTAAFQAADTTLQGSIQSIVDNYVIDTRLVPPTNSVTLGLYDDHTALIYSVDRMDEVIQSLRESPIQILTDDPATVTEGDFWYNSTDDVIRYAIDGDTANIVTLAGLNPLSINSITGPVATHNGGLQYTATRRNGTTVVWTTVGPSAPTAATFIAEIDPHTIPQATGSVPVTVTLGVVGTGYTYDGFTLPSTGIVDEGSLIEANPALPTSGDAGDNTFTFEVNSALEPNTATLSGTILYTNADGEDLTHPFMLTVSIVEPEHTSNVFYTYGATAAGGTVSDTTVLDWTDTGKLVGQQFPTVASPDATTAPDLWIAYPSSHNPVEILTLIGAPYIPTDDDGLSTTVPTDLTNYSIYTMSGYNRASRYTVQEV